MAGVGHLSIVPYGLAGSVASRPIDHQRSLNDRNPQRAGSANCIAPTPLTKYPRRSCRRPPSPWDVIRRAESSRSLHPSYFPGQTPYASNCCAVAVDHSSGTPASDGSRVRTSLRGRRPLPAPERRPAAARRFPTGSERARGTGLVTVLSTRSQRQPPHPASARGLRREQRTTPFSSRTENCASRREIETTADARESCCRSGRCEAAITITNRFETAPCTSPLQ